MSQIPSLISDLAVILISAGLVTLLFKRLKQPVVLGYIVAGILAGPSITQIPTVTDIESIIFSSILNREIHVNLWQE